MKEMDGVAASAGNSFMPAHPDWSATPRGHTWPPAPAPSAPPAADMRGDLPQPDWSLLPPKTGMSCGPAYTIRAAESRDDVICGHQIVSTPELIAAHPAWPTVDRPPGQPLNGPWIKPPEPKHWRLACEGNPSKDHEGMYSYYMQDLGSFIGKQSVKQTPPCRPWLGPKEPRGPAEQPPAGVDAHYTRKQREWQLETPWRDSAGWRQTNSQLARQRAIAEQSSAYFGLANLHAKRQSSKPARRSESSPDLSPSPSVASLRPPRIPFRPNRSFPTGIGQASQGSSSSRSSDSFRQRRKEKPWKMLDMSGSASPSRRSKSR